MKKRMSSLLVEKTAVFLSIVLMLSAVFGQFPASTRAVAASYSISNPVTDSDGVTTWDCIWFGNYWQNDTNGDGVADQKDEKELIKWRVLSVDGDDAFLVADQNLDCQPYNEEDEDVTWETCTLRSWLNNTFLTNAFSSEEQSAIKDTTVVNDDNPVYGTAGGNNTKDKVYLLSIEEVCNLAYGFNSQFDVQNKTREVKNTDYANECGAQYTYNSGSEYTGNGCWWLRSPGYNSDQAAYIAFHGWGSDIQHVNNALDTVRPVLHINLSSSTWSKAGKVSASGGSTESVTASPTPTWTPSPTYVRTPNATQTPEATQILVPTRNPDTTDQTPIPTQKTDSSYGISNPVTDSEGVTTWDCIWFGNYWQSNETTKEPIKWRVLSVNGDDAFLLADQNLDCQPYHTEEYVDVTWETCSLRTWLNDDFYQNAFNSEEQTAIRDTTILNNDNPYYDTSGGNDTTDKVYLLSFTEAGNASYGFNSRFEKDSETRIATNTTYVANADEYMSNSGEASIWWLRSPGDGSDSASYISEKGYGYIYGGYSNNVSNAVRPVLHIDLSTSVWNKAGTVSSRGGNRKADTTENPYGIKNPVMTGNDFSRSVTTWDCIWFGNYWQSSETTKEPIKWRVLSVDGDDAFLLADQNLDTQPYNTTSTDVTWENSSLRTWLNGSFYQTAFNTAEQAAIRTTMVVNDEHPYDDDRSGGNNTSDKVYLLSLAEASNDDYGFDTWFNRESKTRVAVNSAYIEAMDSDCWYWWLRSPGFYHGDVAEVNGDGWGNSFGGSSCDANYAVRPVLHIDLSSSVWSKAGTVNSLGVSTGGVVPTSTPLPSSGSEPSIGNDKENPPDETKKPDDTTNSEKNELEGLSNPRVQVSEGHKWDCVYFGNYYQSKYEPIKEPDNPVNGQEYTDSDGTKMMYRGWIERDEDGERVTHYAYFRKEPIKWRILSQEGNDALLIADQVLDCQKYHSEYKDITWENSSLRKWLNEDFYTTAFNTTERNAINETNVINDDNPVYGIDGGNNTKDKVYLPSVKEVTENAYGFSSNYTASVTRETKTTEFAQASGVIFSQSDTYADNGFWWLRTLGCFSAGASVVEHDGQVYPFGDEVSARYYGIRPMLHLNLSSSVYTNAEKITVEEQISTWDCITFGNYFQSLYKPMKEPENPVDGQIYIDSDGTEMIYRQWQGWDTETYEDISYCAYFRKEPIRWRVLSIEGDDAFLMADQNLDIQPYHITEEEMEEETEWSELTWEISDLRKWLNEDFYNTAFSGQERDAIIKSFVVNKDVDNAAKITTEDNVYLLSVDEVVKAEYGFSSYLEENSQSRQAKDSDYVYYVMGDSDDKGDNYIDKSQWWLRSIAETWYYTALVGSTGHVYEDGTFSDNSSVAVRPVLHLNLSSNTWSKAGTVTSKDAGEGNDRPQVSPKPEPSSKPQETQKPQPSAEPQKTSEPQASLTPVPTQTPPSDIVTVQGQPEQPDNDKQTAIVTDQPEVKKPGKVKSFTAKNNKSGSVRLAWKKVSKASGYQIYYADNKKFRKKTVKNTSKKKYTVKKLKKKKIYYFKIRAYVTKNGKKKYGKWSKVIKIKK